MDEMASKRLRPLASEQKKFLDRLIVAGQLPDTPIVRIRLQGAFYGLEYLSDDTKHIEEMLDELKITDPTERTKIIKQAEVCMRIDPEISYILVEFKAKKLRKQHQQETEKSH